MVALKGLISQVRWPVRLAVVAMSLSGLIGCGPDAPDQADSGTAGTASAQAAQAQAAHPAASTALSKTPTQVFPITVAEVVRHPMAAYLQGTATLESPSQVQVLAKTAGLAMRIVVEEGESVERGQLLAQLDDREARLALDQARIQLAEAELAYKSLVHLDQREAKLELRRAQLTAAEAREKHDKALTMKSRGLASQQEVDAARTQKAIADVAVQQAQVRLQYKTVDDARFRYEKAQTELQEAELHLSYTQITASITGIISDLPVVPGQFVNVGESLLTIVDVTRLRARTFLPENVLHQLQPGQPAHIEIEAFAGQPFPARVQLISPVVDAESGTFKVTVELLQPPPALRPGMFATVFIRVAQRDQALVIPKRALTLSNSEPSVYRLQDGHAYRVALRLGFTQGEQVEVTSGLSEGDQVVVMGRDKVLDGAAVQIVENNPLERRPNQKK